MSEPTLDGLTADDLMDHCVGTALIRYQADNHDEPLSDGERLVFELGANDGALSMFEELLARGLIVARP